MPLFHVNERKRPIYIIIYAYGIPLNSARGRVRARAFSRCAAVAAEAGEPSTSTQKFLVTPAWVIRNDSPRLSIATAGTISLPRHHRRSVRAACRAIGVCQLNCRRRR